MRTLDEQSAIVAGGWDHRYAVTLAVATQDDIAAALVDTNGDGADIDLDVYVRGPDGSWQETCSGNADDEGAQWTHRVVATWGRATPGHELTVEYVGQRHPVIANPAGWWLFIAPTSDPDAMPRRDAPTHAHTRMGVPLPTVGFFQPESSVAWAAMEPWGAMQFGDPCRDCAFDWSISPEAAVDWVSNLRPLLATVTASAEGSERREAGGWSVTQYVCHVGDNLRQWAERVQGARLAGTVEVSGYDPDDLALARRYETLPLAAALWSTGQAIDAWVSVLPAALAEEIALQHETRGAQRAEDVARNNCHDAHHHAWDISQILLEISRKPPADVGGSS